MGLWQTCRAVYGLGNGFRYGGSGMVGKGQRRRRHGRCVGAVVVVGCSSGPRHRFGCRWNHGGEWSGVGWDCCWLWCGGLGHTRDCSREPFGIPERQWGMMSFRLDSRERYAFSTIGRIHFSVSKHRTAPHHSLTYVARTMPPTNSNSQLHSTVHSGVIIFSTVDQQLMQGHPPPHHSFLRKRPSSVGSFEVTRVCVCVWDVCGMIGVQRVRAGAGAFLENEE